MSAACGASRVHVDPPQIEQQAIAPLWPCAEAGVVLHALSPGFDTRSREMYWQLLMLRDQGAPAPLAQPAHYRSASRSAAHVWRISHWIVNGYERELV